MISRSLLTSVPSTNSEPYALRHSQISLRPNVDAQALLKFDVDTAQFGKVYAGDTVFYDFGFTNIGNEDLIIKQAWPACGCTTPTFTEGAIKPGERGVIKVQFRSAGFAGQTMVKQIIVINNGAEKYAVFKVKVVDKAIEEDILKHQSQTNSKLKYEFH